ncbi:hypothetical protein [Cryptosporangium sp. NPDC048952]|uniref:hypothetical protein n=1 Tax=Cryptosporangium sp. NPDC048952 TaxID=3363961 RepID=UPI0037246094
MNDLPPPSRDLPPGVHSALRARVLEETYDEAPSRRRWLLPLAAAAAVLVVVFTAIGVLRAGSPSPEPAPVATHPPSGALSPSVSGPPPVNPTTFDPLWTRLTPNWVPADFPVTERAVSRSDEMVRLGGYAEPMIQISITPRTAPAPLQHLPADTTVPGPDVNGKASTWSERAATRRSWLRWEWADGAGAIVQLFGFEGDSSENAEFAARIAAGLRPQSPVRVALPFTVTGPSHAWVLGSIVHRPKETGSTSVRFGPSAGVLKETEVRWTPDRLVQQEYPSNTTVNGREASVRTDGVDEVVRQVFSRNVGEVTCRPKPGVTRETVRSECLTIAASLTPFGDVNAPTSWSTSPVR